MAGLNGFPPLPSLVINISFFFSFPVSLCLNIMNFFCQNTHSSSLPQGLCSVCTLLLDCFLSLHNPCQAKAFSFPKHVSHLASASSSSPGLPYCNPDLSVDTSPSLHGPGALTGPGLSQALPCPSTSQHAVWAPLPGLFVE